MHPYATPAYAQSLSHWGQALHVPAWNTSVIIRPFNATASDASGTYPLAILSPEADIEAGLTFLKQQGLVSVTLVLDDIHRPALPHLEKHAHILRPFKTHYIYRPSLGPLTYDKNHRYELRHATQHIHTEVIDLAQHLEAWINLYQTLTEKHALKGLHAFPHHHFETLATLPGITTFAGWKGSELVSAHIWVHHNGYAHSHLAASSDVGYQHRAAYAVNNAAIQHFTNAKALSFGGGAGFSNQPTDGLSRFKKGFSNTQSNAYIFGVILDEPLYDKLLMQRDIGRESSFFPAYRAP